MELVLELIVISFFGGGLFLLYFVCFLRESADRLGLGVSRRQPGPSGNGDSVSRGVSTSPSVEVSTAAAS